MPDLTVQRVWSDDTGTFGVFSDDKGPFAVTVELPWRDNAKMVSCIPAGKYLCKRVKSPKHGDTFEITGVPGRSSVLFHKANTIADLLGCIGVGESFNPVNGVRGITESGKGFGEFLTLQHGLVSFWLTVNTVP